MSDQSEHNNLLHWLEEKLDQMEARLKAFIENLIGQGPPAPPSPGPPQPGPPNPPTTTGTFYWIIDPTAAALVSTDNITAWLVDLVADGPTFAADWPHVGSWGHQAVSDASQVPAGGVASTLVATLPEAPNALAYHSVDNNGVPFVRVGVQVCQDNGVDWRSAADHEVKETKADPSCAIVVQDPQGRSVAYEVGDPVEGHSYPAGPGQSPMSDYVTPLWFGQAASDANEPFSHTGDATAAWQIAADGYCVVDNQDVNGPGQAFRADAVQYGDAFPDFRRRSVEAIAGLSRRQRQ